MRHGRTLADEVDDLARVSFKLPPDMLRPAADAQRAQSAAAARAHDSAAQQAGPAAGKPIPPVMTPSCDGCARECMHEVPC